MPHLPGEAGSGHADFWDIGNDGGAEILRDPLIYGWLYKPCRGWPAKIVIAIETIALLPPGQDCVDFVIDPEAAVVLGPRSIRRLGWYYPESRQGQAGRARRIKTRRKSLARGLSGKQALSKRRQTG